MMYVVIYDCYLWLCDDTYSWGELSGVVVLGLFMCVLCVM